MWYANDAIYVSRPGSCMHIYIYIYMSGVVRLVYINAQSPFNHMGGSIIIQQTNHLIL